jgi:hypothetical protein
MKQMITILFCFLSAIDLLAQPTEIVNTRLSLSTSTDSLIVNYDLTGNLPAINVKLNVTDSIGKNIYLQNITGDLGKKIMPGFHKTIIWNMAADKAEVYGSKLFVNVSGNIIIPGNVKREIWIPWLYIVAGASAATGIYAHLKANSLYQNYPGSTITDEAEYLHSEINQLEIIRDVAFGAAGVTGIAGIVVHIRHKQKMKAVAISYIPIPDGAVFGLTCNF